MTKMMKLMKTIIVIAIVSRPAVSEKAFRVVDTKNNDVIRAAKQVRPDREDRA